VLRFNQTKALCYRNSLAEHISATPCIRVYFGCFHNIAKNVQQPQIF
jgi:hypothetical protein